MLTTIHKADILRRAGYTVAVEPEPGTGPEVLRSEALMQWQQSVETLFVEYAAARAARSLRDAEEHRQLCRLRRMASHSMPARLR